MTEVWQRGPLPNVPPLLQPVAHALLQAREELTAIMLDFPDNLINERPANMASPAFHLQHLAGVLDRVFTYARAEKLTSQQFDELALEDHPIEEGAREKLVQRFNLQVDLAITQLIQTDQEILTDHRSVGRAGLPSTVIGLLVHAAEHTMRHVGQLMVTVAVLKHKRKEGL